MGWGKFLINELIPTAKRVEAHWAQSADDVLSLLGEDIDLFLPHINMSLTGNVPSDRENLINKLEDRGVRVLNSSITDTTKKNIQESLIDAGLPTVKVLIDKLDGDDLVVVKSNLNCGGGMERKLKTKDKKMLGLVGYDRDKVPSTKDYKVVKAGEVDELLLNDKMIQLERFVSNKKDRLWRAYIVGDRVSIIEAIVLGDIKKSKDAMKSKNHNYKFGDTKSAKPSFGPANMDKLFDYIERYVKFMKLDFCSLDIIESDEGEFYIIDLNITTHWGNRNAPDILENLKLSNILN